MRNAFLVLIACCLVLPGCYGMRPSAGGGTMSELVAERKVDPADIALPDGYTAEVVATGLTFPTGVAFDDSGTPYVVEAGYSYGEVWDTPRLLRIEGGRPAVVAGGGKNGPWTGVARHDGVFFIAEGGALEGGRILRITDQGQIRSIVEALPTRGDHHTNGPAVGSDGLVYFGLGTATNSAVVGEDNAKFGWLERYPAFHDTPCRDVTLNGANYTAKTADGTTTTTGAYSPFGTATAGGQVIKGTVPCSGAVLRVPPTGGTLELVAWGFRNPFGLAFSPDGTLFVTDNGYDERGSRPVFGAADVLWKVAGSEWFGWPDFSAGMRLDQGDQFKPPGEEKPKLLLASHPSLPPQPAAILPVHSSANSFDFSRSDTFGHRGEAFIPLFGDQSPTTGKSLAPVGFKVVRVNTATGAVEEFAANRGKKNGPASGLGTGGLERPIAARFDPSGNYLYIVDFGILKETKEGSRPLRKTGVLWRIGRKP